MHSPEDWVGWPTIKKERTLTPIEKLSKEVSEARVRGVEKQRVLAEEFNEKKRDRVMQTYMQSLPHAIEQAVALDKKTMVFMEVPDIDSEHIGLDEYGPRHGSDVDIVLGVLAELGLEASIQKELASFWVVIKL